MKADAREQALLRLIAEYRERDCRRLLEDARRRAAEMRRQTYARERAALHERVRAERSRAEGLIQAARAERATRARRHSEQTDRDVLAQALPALREALRARWREDDSRVAWVRGAFARALALLPRGDWGLRHAPDWPARERAELLTELEQALGAAPGSQSDASISAGLVIRAGGASLDVSLEGLLADRARIEARALALWKERASAAESQHGSRG